MYFIIGLLKRENNFCSLVSENLLFFLMRLNRSHVKMIGSADRNDSHYIKTNTPQFMFMDIVCVLPASAHIKYSLYTLAIINLAQEVCR